MIVRPQRALVDVAWVPGWYELDPPREVGLTDEFAFWRVVPEYLRGPEPLVLYNTLWHPEDAVIARGTIAAIRHPELGAIRKVDTRRLYDHSYRRHRVAG